MNTAPLSANHLDAYRRRLESLVNRLTGQVNELELEATRPIPSEDGTDGDSSGANTEADEEVARGILSSESELLAEARDALHRMDIGTFGRCDGCGRGIPRARLDAVPYARRCVRCARAGEAAH